MMKHRHAVKTTRTTLFFGPVRTPENRKAHGNVCLVDTCRCGAVRRSNRNAGAVEMGLWIPSDEVDT